MQNFPFSGCFLLAELRWIMAGGDSADSASGVFEATLVLKPPSITPPFAPWSADGEIMLLQEGSQEAK